MKPMASKEMAQERYQQPQKITEGQFSPTVLESNDV